MAFNNYTSKKVSLLTCLFVFLLCSLIKAQPLSTEHKQVYSQIIGLSFDSGSLDNINDLSPQEAYLLHTHYALTFLFTEDPGLLKLLEDRSPQLNEIIENAEASPWKDFYSAETKLQSAFINLKTGNELSAAWQIRQAYKIILKNNEAYPEFELNYKTLGLLHVMIGAIPEQYQWIIGLMGMEGDIEQGLRELKKIEDANSIYKLETAVLQQVIRSYLLGETKTAAEEALIIAQHNPDNILVAYITAALFLKNNNARQAKNIISKANKTHLLLLHYQEGEIYLQLGNYDKAQRAFKDFISSYKGLNFIKDAHYKLFLSYWLNNNESEAMQFFKKGKEVGQTLTEADKHANRMLQQEKFPNKTIMKIRLFTDGGEYGKAKALINETSEADFSKTQDALEFTYRKARLYHKTGELLKAIGHYEQVINDQTENQYYAPNSCLQLAYIYSEKGQINKAKEYFNKVLSYRNYEYKNSIGNKAKAAIKVLH